MDFSENDFSIFAKADGDSCKACMNGEKNGREVTQNEFHDYRDQFVDILQPKFEELWSLIDPILADRFKIHLNFNFEPKSQMPKMRPFCYSILTEKGTGQNRAQLNLRLSYDERPDDLDGTNGDVQRRRKFGVKFSLHHKCKQDLTNHDLPNFVNNIKQFPEGFVNLLHDLDDGFLVFKNYGKGIESDFIRANQIDLDEIDDLLLAKEEGDVYFQEIHKSFYWDDEKHKRIISNHNRLAAECVKALFKLYPIYLYAVIRDKQLLPKALKVFGECVNGNSEVFKCTRVRRLEKAVRKIPENQRINIKQIYQPYAKDATFIEIGDNFIGLNPRLRDAIVDFCSLVESRPYCKVRILTNEYDNFHPNQRQGVTEVDFIAALSNLKERLLRLGFSSDKYELSFCDMRERRLRTNLWDIRAGHPLDFFKASGLTKEIRLHFIPRREIVCE